MNNYLEIKAPNEVPTFTDKVKVFLAGSIEMGSAIDWQKEIVEKLKDENILFLNPRRDDWDSSWTQSITNLQFRTQVTWELDNLDTADFIIMYFAPNTKSPISLLELGLYATTNKMIVCCPEGFWRKGNVEIVCDRYNIELVNTLDELIISLKNLI